MTSVPFAKLYNMYKNDKVVSLTCSNSLLSPHMNLEFTIHDTRTILNYPRHKSKKDILSNFRNP